MAVVAESQAAGYDESHRDKSAESKLSHHVAQSPVTAWLLMWSGEANQRSIRGPINSNERNQNIEIKRFTQEQFFTWFLIRFLFFIRHLKAENTTVSAAILCPAVCSSDVVNKSTCVAKVANMSWANLFLLFIGEELTSMAVPWGAPLCEAEMHFFCMDSNRTVKWSVRSQIFCTVSAFQASLRLWFFSL